jgi:hypothetical protein
MSTKYLLHSSGPRERSNHHFRMKLSERTFGDHSPKIDREAGIIRDVKILGFHSANGRRYTEQAVRKAVGLYEGVGVNVDHIRTGEDRPTRDHFGELRNVRFVEGKGLVGDLHYLKSHPEAETILERAERMPGQFGLSHDADGEVQHTPEGLEVTHITAVESVDIVRSPATNQSLFESRKPTMKIRQLLEGTHKGPFIKLLREMADYDDEVSEMDVPAEAPADKPEDQIKSGLMAAIQSKLEVASPEELKKILKVLGIGDSLTDSMTSGSAPAEESDDPLEEADKDPEMKEALRRMQRRTALLEAENALLQSGRPVKPVWVQAMVNLQESERKQFVDSLPKNESTGRPHTSPGKFSDQRLTESDSEFDQLVASGASMWN